MATNSANIFPRLKYKLVVVGDESTGKTSILSRFMYDTFNPSYKVTIGVDFVSKNFYLQDRVVRLQLWDTAGQERFKSLIPSYIRESSVALVVFDVSSRKSFHSTTAWIRDIRTERGTDVVLVLVGNKVDLPNRVVSEEEAKAHAESLNIAYVETSAKTGHNVKQLFSQIAHALPHVSQGQGTPNASTNVNLNTNTNAEKAKAPSVDISKTPENTEEKGYCGGCGM